MCFFFSLLSLFRRYIFVHFFRCEKYSHRLRDCDVSSDSHQRDRRRLRKGHEGSLHGSSRGMQHHSLPLRQGGVRRFSRLWAMSLRGPLQDPDLSRQHEMRHHSGRYQGWNRIQGSLQIRWLSVLYLKKKEFSIFFLCFEEANEKYLHWNSCE